MNKAKEENQDMTALDVIKATYSLADFKEIVERGCQSGVCSKHRHYGENINFFDENQDEIVDYIECNHGTEFLVELFKNADASLRDYKNSVVWAFIETIAMEEVKKNSL